jgi:hypothetical protein
MSWFRVRKRCQKFENKVIHSCFYLNSNIFWRKSSHKTIWSRQNYVSYIVDSSTQRYIDYSEFCDELITMWNFRLLNIWLRRFTRLIQAECKVPKSTTTHIIHLFWAYQLVSLRAIDQACAWSNPSVIEWWRGRRRQKATPATRAEIFCGQNEAKKVRFFNIHQQQHQLLLVFRTVFEIFIAYKLFSWL